MKRKKAQEGVILGHTVWERYVCILSLVHFPALLSLKGIRDGYFDSDQEPSPLETTPTSHTPLTSDSQTLQFGCLGISGGPKQALPSLVQVSVYSLYISHISCVIPVSSRDSVVQ